MSDLRSLLFLAPALALALAPLAIGRSQTSPAASQPAQTQPGNINPYAGFSRNRIDEELPGRAVGIVVSDQGFNFCVAEMMGVPKWDSPPQTYRYAFSRGGTKYRPLDWHSDDPLKALTFREPVPTRNGRSATREFVGLCVADTDSARAKGVGPPFSLVEVEVNEGFGSPSDSFAATEVKLIHKTAQYPLDPVKIMADAKIRLQKYKEANTQLVNSTMAELKSTALGDKQATGPRETRDHAIITWLPETERVRVEIQSVTTDGAYTDVPERVLMPPETDSPAHSPPVGITPARRTGTQFGVSGGVLLEYSRDGTLTKEGQHSFRTFIAPFAERLPAR